MKTEHEIHDRERRCPRLGGSVRFGYCHAGDDALPCFKICDCWWEYFDVVDYLKGKLSDRDFENLMKSRPKPKITGLLQLIELAQKRSCIDD
ncbi:MAG: hypothetical protein HY881_01950 [Deltaproteobacteria bacterium]|nr:hypothetical protein [Deltaproteobacteria bacterium]